MRPRFLVTHTNREELSSFRPNMTKYGFQRFVLGFGHPKFFSEDFKIFLKKTFFSKNRNFKFSKLIEIQFKPIKIHQQSIKYPPTNAKQLGIFKDTQVTARNLRGKNAKKLGIFNDTQVTARNLKNPSKINQKSIKNP